MSAFDPKQTSGLGDAPLADRMAVTPRVSRSRANVRGPFFSFFGRDCCAFKKDRGTFQRTASTSAVNLPLPWLRRVASQFHDDRIVGWVKFLIVHTGLTALRVLGFKGNSMQ